MIKYKVGDRVKVIDDNTHGIITQITQDQITIESEYGFDETYLPNEILPDVDLDEEIEEVEEKADPEFKSKKSKIKKSKFDQKIEKENAQKAEFEQMINDNFAQNSDNYRQKLEERYQKEIKVSKKKKGTFVLDLHYGQLENFSAQLPVQRILKRQLNAAINGIEKLKIKVLQKLYWCMAKVKAFWKAK